VGPQVRSVDRLSGVASRQSLYHIPDAGLKHGSDSTGAAPKVELRQRLKPNIYKGRSGTAEAVPFQTYIRRVEKADPSRLPGRG
jgi:hypothetical protein